MALLVAVQPDSEPIKDRMVPQGMSLRVSRERPRFVSQEKPESIDTLPYYHVLEQF